MLSYLLLNDKYFLLQIKDNRIVQNQSSDLNGVDLLFSLGIIVW